VNKKRFNHLVQDYSQVTSEVKELERLVMEYPYSQPVRMLTVKGSSNLSKKEYQQRVTLAAFYATDRNVLRSLIEKGKVPSDFNVAATKKTVIKPEPSEPIRSAKQKTAEVKAKLVVKTEVKQKRIVIADKKPIDAVHLREEVIANLTLLQESKAAFLKLADLEETVAKNPKKPAPAKPKTTKKKQEDIPEQKVAVSTKQKLVPPATSPKAKKNELIDKFIATQPRITPGQAIKDNQSDLSKASSELKEDLVSENLAIIFAKQGKTGKAIDIYKKLIWKFPQKKASFATRIEELKKK
jgi:hypothetical protein